MYLENANSRLYFCARRVTPKSEPVRKSISADRPAPHLLANAVAMAMPRLS